MSTSPPEIGMMIYKTIYQIANAEDPFRRIKKQCTKHILSLYPELKQRVISSDDPLYTALRYAGFGNTIDYGANPDFDLYKEMNGICTKNFDICEYEKFKKAMNDSKRVLYIADNAGETVFDKLLMEQIGGPITYAVRSSPIINDATIDDAHDAGIDEVADIIASGCDAPGTILRLCSREFKEIIKSSDMIICKGQGNYETLSGQNYPIFFLLKIKCSVVAHDIGIKVGSLILKKNKYAK